MELDYTLVKFKDINLKTREGVKLRGYFANQYKENTLMHNHNGDQLIFEYPKIQYKVIKNMPYICGIEEGARIAAQVGLSTDEITIEDIDFAVYEKQIIKEKAAFGAAPDYIEYQFLTPWMALNQKNIDFYRKSGSMQKEELLKRILIGNVLSLSKGVGYSVEEELRVWIDLEEIAVKFKNLDMIAFKGGFKINFSIPDYLGLGKAVSRGFGAVRRR